MREKIPFNHVSFLFIFILLFLDSPGVSAIEITLDVGTGYDNNPSLSDNREESSFQEYYLSLFHLLPVRRNGEIDFSAYASYQDYSSVEDNFRIGTSAEVVYGLFRGQILLSILGELSLYRDDLVPEDERNEAGTGVGIQWIPLDIFSMEIGHRWKWLDFQNSALPLSGRGMGGANSINSGAFSAMNASVQGYRYVEGVSLYSTHNGRSNRQRKLARTKQPPRDDRLETTSLTLAYSPPFRMDVEIDLFYSRLFSTVPLESFKQYGTLFTLTFHPASNWQASGSFLWTQTDYEKSPHHIDRTDYLKKTGIKTSYFFQAVELYLQAFWTDNDSPLDGESYSGSITSMGIAYTF